MSELEDDKLDWNPTAQYIKESSKIYRCIGEEIPKEYHNTNKSKYPYLLIRKTNMFITENLLKNFFGDIIYDIEYRPGSRVFCVYFHNIRCLEAAWNKIRQFPDIVHCVEGRRRRDESYEPKPSINAEQVKIEQEHAFCEPSHVDLTSRTIPVSAVKNNHAEFVKSPIVIKSDYTAKKSLLAVNDVSFRYLNVKYEFTLERHGAYTSQDIKEKDQALLHYKSGRLVLTPKNQFESTPVDIESKFENLTRKCLACSCYTDISCKFCLMPFCNPICFDALFAVHKNCDKDTSMEIENTVVAPHFKNLILPPSGSTVKISAFEQTNVLYVRSAETVAEIFYYKVVSDVMMHGKLASKLINLPQLGQIVIYKSSVQIVRAMVLNVDNPRAIYVVCVDYGNVEITTMESLYECNASLAALPRYAVPVLLQGVPSRYMPPNLRSILYELDHNFTFVLKYSEGEFDTNKGMHRVILVETEMNLSLNRLIKTILTPIEPSISDIGYKEGYLDHIPLPTGKNVELVIMDNSFIKCGIIHCTILDYAYEITQMERDIQIYGESIAKCPSFTANQNYLCIAKYLGNWCRGLSLELVGDGYPSILFIDHGNIAPIHVNDTRPYPAQFTFPVLTTEYDLLGLPEDLTDVELTRLQKYLSPGAIVNCDEVIYNKEANNYSMRLEAVQMLTKRN